MSRNTLGRKFNGLVVLVIVIPLIVGIWIYAEYRDALSASHLMLPAGAYGIFLCCMIVLAYIAGLRERNFAGHLEKARKEALSRSAELNILRDLSGMPQEGMSAEDLLKLILDKAMQVVAVRRGSIFVVDPAVPEGLRLVDAKPPVVIAQDESGKANRFSFVKTVIESGKAMRIQDIEHDPRTLKANDPKYGAPSFVSMPVYKNRQVIAVMNLANKESGGIFTESDERILSIMLAGVGTVIETVTLRQQAKIQQAQIRELQARIK